MSMARTAGRKGRPTRRLFAAVRAESDICILCHHPGARAVNHDKSWADHPELRMDRTNLAVIHGIEGCPVCPWKYSRRRKAMAPRVCNSELGKRSVAEYRAGRKVKRRPVLVRPDRDW